MIGRGQPDERRDLGSLEDINSCVDKDIQRNFEESWDCVYWN